MLNRKMTFGTLLAFALLALSVPVRAEVVLSCHLTGRPGERSFTMIVNPVEETVLIRNSGYESWIGRFLNGEYFSAAPKKRDTTGKGGEAVFTSRFIELFWNDFSGIRLDRETLKLTAIGVNDIKGKKWIDEGSYCRPGV